MHKQNLRTPITLETWVSMHFGALFGWDDPGAYASSYDTDGTPAEKRKLDD